MSSGLVVYDGPSMLNGARVLGILTGIPPGPPSLNSAVGFSSQLWTVDPEEHPVEKPKGGFDAVCGDCPAKKWCYVGPRASASVFRCYHAGGYGVWDGESNPFLGGAWQSGAARTKPGALFPVRFGADGDPAALPVEVLERPAHLAGRRNWLGYTHQWRSIAPELAPRYAALLMASCDSPRDLADALATGGLWRPFYVMVPGEQLPEGAFWCPKDDKQPGGARLQCVKCRACWGSDGTEGKAYPAVVAHGFPHLVKRFVEWRASL